MSEETLRPGQRLLPGVEVVDCGVCGETHRPITKCFRPDRAETEAGLMGARHAAESSHPAHISSGEYADGCAACDGESLAGILALADAIDHRAAVHDG